jgi:uncharacterized membrane protein
MPTYDVRIEKTSKFVRYEVSESWVEIEAENKKEAERIAREKIEQERIHIGTIVWDVREDLDDEFFEGTDYDVTDVDDMEEN